MAEIVRFRLDRASIIGSAVRMRPTVRRILSTVIVAVAFAASAMNGYASVLNAFDVHEHGPHGIHSHGHHHDHGHGAAHEQLDAAASDVAAAQDHSEGSTATDDQACQHIHAQCCAAFAVTVADNGFSVAVYVRAVVPVANSHLPPGRIASPLFRPPRIAA